MISVPSGHRHASYLENPLFLLDNRSRHTKSSILFWSQKQAALWALNQFIDHLEIAFLDLSSNWIGSNEGVSSSSRAWPQRLRRKIPGKLPSWSQRFQACREGSSSTASNTRESSEKRRSKNVRPSESPIKDCKRNGKMQIHKNWTAQAQKYLFELVRVDTFFPT